MYEMFSIHFLLCTKLAFYEGNRLKSFKIILMTKATHANAIRLIVLFMEQYISIGFEQAIIFQKYFKCFVYMRMIINNSEYISN